MSDAPALSTAYLAAQCAEARRALVSLYTSDLRLLIAYDLMGYHPGRVSPERRAVANTIAATHANSLRKADLYLADPAMCTLVDTAAPTMPDQELREDDPLSQHGFLLFADPLPDRTGTDPLIPVSALSWSVLGPRHPLLLERAAGPSVLLTAYVTAADYAATMGPDYQMAGGAPPLLPNATVMWTIGSLIGSVFGDVPERTDVTPGFYQRLAATFWTLARQPLTQTEHAPAGRASARRKHAKYGIERPDQPVRVVRLQHRRAAAAEGEQGESGPGGRQFSVQWAVKGHWRNAFLPSTGGHRHTWIAPYIKGPEGAPFKGGERVFLAEGGKVPHRQD